MPAIDITCKAEGKYVLYMFFVKIFIHHVSKYVYCQLYIYIPVLDSDK